MSSTRDRARIPLPDSNFLIISCGHSCATALSYIPPKPGKRIVMCNLRTNKTAACQYRNARLTLYVCLRLNFQSFHPKAFNLIEVSEIEYKYLSRGPSIRSGFKIF